MANRDFVVAADAIYQLGPAMDETGSARPFMHGRSQAVCVPEGFPLPGDRVQVRLVGDGVLLEPVTTDVHELFALLDRYRDSAFIEDSRQQPCARATRTCSSGCPDSPLDTDTVVGLLRDRPLPVRVRF
ncbi:MAG TPA: hypothetical protein VER37_07640 [Thermomicrobiales bacterium]|nr:hypothetical protein [Thermomicrobiales bacterium]